ncbi:MAG TPA: sulfate adenylyltransferase subunit CysN [Pirellulaceae bacterium]|mgnify:CR=1 FL=1|nr:sulfate adenylyltransferase subunit CysN [Pirellulaceae bacterium]
MSHHSDLIATDIHAYLAEHERKELLRFITCGSVDDGKSTLIGRLLYDSKMIYEDQLAKIEKDSLVHGTTGGAFDPALLTDGLKAEREQGITIDVAYRYFSTSKRKFIIADTPGHVQYTRNMATGASTADLAIILIDARHGVLEQTRRHSFIVSLLGIRHILVAINKMDLVQFDESVYERIRTEYREFATRLDIPDLHFIPIAALHGDNVVDPSTRMSWYQGPTLMSFLETVYIGSDRNLEDFRFPVQYVIRPHLNFRGFAGTVASGIIRQGEDVMILPSRKTTAVKSIVTREGELEEAFAPQSVVITLRDEVDVSRGDMIVRPGNLPKVQHEFEAMLVWMHDQPLVPGKQYLFKQTTHTAAGMVATLRYRVDVNTLHRMQTPALKLNEIGRCKVSLSQPLVFDGYRRNRTTGAFIVIDRITNATVGAGMILDRETSERRGDFWDASPVSQTLVSQASHVTSEERQLRYGQRAATILLTGLPGSGKSSVAYALERQLFDSGRSVTVIDGQNFRLGLSRDLGFGDEARSENVRRAAEVAKLINQAGLICIVALVAPREETRRRAAELVGEESFVVVHLQRDGATDSTSEADSDVAVSGPIHFEKPQQVDLTLDTHATPLEECVARIVALLESKRFI